MIGSGSAERRMSVYSLTILTKFLTVPGGGFVGNKYGRRAN